MMPERTLARAPLTRLHPDPDQPRKTFDRQGLISLADSLRSVGQQTPLIVCASPRVPPDAFMILDGERRFRAAPFVPLSEMDCIVLFEQPDMLDMLAIQLSLGSTNERLNPYELADGASRLMRERGLTQESVAEMLGIAPSTLSKAKRITEHLAPELRPDVESGALPYTIAALIAQLEGNVPAQVDLAARVKAGAKRSQIEGDVRELLRKRPKQAKPGKGMRVTLNNGIDLAIPADGDTAAVRAALEAAIKALARLEKERWGIELLPRLLEN